MKYNFIFICAFILLFSTNAFFLLNIKGYFLLLISGSLEIFVFIILAFACSH